MFRCFEQFLFNEIQSLVAIPKLVERA